MEHRPLPFFAVSCPLSAFGSPGETHWSPMGHPFLGYCAGTSTTGPLSYSLGDEDRLHGTGLQTEAQRGEQLQPSAVGLWWGQDKPVETWQSGKASWIRCYLAFHGGFQPDLERQQAGTCLELACSGHTGPPSRPDSSNCLRFAQCGDPFLTSPCVLGCFQQDPKDKTEVAGRDLREEGSRQWEQHMQRP